MLNDTIEFVCLFRSVGPLFFVVLHFFGLVYQILNKILFWARLSSGTTNLDLGKPEKRALSKDANGLYELPVAMDFLGDEYISSGTESAAHKIKRRKRPERKPADHNRGCIFLWPDASGHDRRGLL